MALNLFDFTLLAIFYLMGLAMYYLYESAHDKDQRILDNPYGFEEPTTEHDSFFQSLTVFEYGED